MPYIVPQAPPSPGQEFARDLLKQAIMAAITQGASLPFAGLGMVAKSGQYTSPTGASTFISPAERMAGNPSMSAAQTIQQQAPPTASFIPTQYGLGRVPDYAQDLNRAKVQNLPLERKKLEGDIANQGALSGLYSQMGFLKQIEDAALSGDEDAAAAYRWLKSRGAF